MTSAISVIVFDVNETLSDMSPMSDRFREVGAPADMAKPWFATLLRDGFALAVSGDNGSFSTIGADVLRRLLSDVRLDRPLDEVVEHVMGGMKDLDVHPDVPAGIRALKGAGFRLVTLSNGSAQIAEEVFSHAGIRDEFEAVLSVENASAWKPVRSSYDYAAASTGSDPGSMLLVAVHPWDIHGASRAGLRTAWLNRTGDSYPAYFAAPEFTVSSLTGLAPALAAAY
ncbi:haloacid dehalogenase type II [Arthrobacter sp. MMS24-T111]